MDFLTTIITVNIALGMLGGVLGVLIARDGEQMRWLTRVLYAVVGAGLAAAAIEKFGVTSPWVAFAFGFGSGVISGDAVPFLKAVSPKLYEKIERWLGIKKD